MPRLPVGVLSTLLLFSAFCLGAVSVQAEMLVSPTRAVLDEENRTAQLTLRNTGDGARTYRLKWEQKRMTESGRYESVEDEADWQSASGMLRYSPRQITVGPQENQRVRLSYRPPEDVAPGEYRSHLRLQVLPDVSEPAAVIEQGDTNGEGIGFRLRMQMSFSLPVIVRHEQSRPQVSISNVEVSGTGDDERPRLGITLSRNGTASSFGDVIVEMQRDSNSPVETIGRSSDVAVFHEMDERRLRVPLRDTEIPAGAWVRVAYEGRQEYRDHLWDERVFQVQ